MARKKNKGWVDVTDTFSMEERHYRNSFMEICEVYDQIEVSLFTIDDSDRCEIYVLFNYLSGVVKTKKEEEPALRKEIKDLLVSEYNKKKENYYDFIKEFTKKYDFEWEDPNFFELPLEEIIENLSKKDF